LKKEKGNCEIQGARQLQLTDIHAISFNIGLNYPSVMKFGGWTSIFPIIKKKSSFCLSDPNILLKHSKR
jgi:hypothetical protein